MTEKRFTFDEDANEDKVYELGVFLDNGEIMETTDVLECLNELYEENTNLKTQLDYLQDENQHMRRVLNENTRLKNTCNSLAETTEQLQNTNEKLRKDNLEAFALLGTVRAYIRLGNLDDAIKKINQFEKEQLQ